MPTTARGARPRPADTARRASDRHLPAAAGALPPLRGPRRAGPGLSLLPGPQPVDDGGRSHRRTTPPPRRRRGRGERSKPSPPLGRRSGTRTAQPPEPLSRGYAQVATLGHALCYFASATLAEDDERRSLAVSMAKAAAGDCQRLLVQEGIQSLGGIGYTWEHDMHLYVKRAKSGDAVFGTARQHRARVGPCPGSDRGRRRLDPREVLFSAVSVRNLRTATRDAVQAPWGGSPWLLVLGDVPSGGARFRLS